MELQIKQTQRELNYYEDTKDRVYEKIKKNQGTIKE